MSVSWEWQPSKMRQGMGNTLTSFQSRHHGLSVLNGDSPLLFALSNDGCPPHLELGAGSNTNSVLASDRLVTSSDLLLLSNDDISLYLNADRSSETSQFELFDRFGAEVFRVDDAGNLVTQGAATAEQRLEPTLRRVSGLSFTSAQRGRVSIVLAAGGALALGQSKYGTLAGALSKRQSFVLA